MYTFICIALRLMRFRQIHILSRYLKQGHLAQVPLSHTLQTVSVFRAFDELTRDPIWQNDGITEYAKTKNDGISLRRRNDGMCAEWDLKGPERPCENSMKMKKYLKSTQKQLRLAKPRFKESDKQEQQRSLTLRKESFVRSSAA